MLLFFRKLGYILQRIFVQFHHATNVNKSITNPVKLVFLQTLFHRDSLKTNSQKFFSVVKLQFLLMRQQTCSIMLTGEQKLFRDYHIYDLSLGSHWLLICCCPMS